MYPFSREKAAKVDEGWEFWCADDRLDAVGWAGVFIWGALVLPGIGQGDLAVWIWPLLPGGAGVAILYSVLGGRR